MPARPTLSLLSSMALATACGPTAAVPQPSFTGVTGATAVASGPAGSWWVTHDLTHALYRCASGACTRIEGEWYAPWGVATAGSGEVCVAHLDSDDPLTSQTRITCLSDGEPRTELDPVGMRVRGLATAPEGVWAAAWRDSPAMGREGELLLVVNGGVRRRVAVAERWPQHLVELPGGDLLVSVWRMDGAGFSAGEILRVDGEGRLGTFSDALEQPSGLAVGAGAMWAADHAAGTVVRLSADGQPTTVREGLSSPLGLAFRDPFTLCVTSSSPEPIQCFSVQDLLGVDP